MSHKKNVAKYQKENPEKCKIKNKRNTDNKKILKHMINFRLCFAHTKTVTYLVLSPTTLAKALHQPQSVYTLLLVRILIYTFSLHFTYFGTLRRRNPIKELKIDLFSVHELSYL